MQVAPLWRSPLRARGLEPELLLRGDGLHLGSRAANRIGERLLHDAGIPLQRHSTADTAADLAAMRRARR